MSGSSGWIRALERTRQATFGRVASLLGFTELTPDAWEEIEQSLLQADLGPATAAEIIARLREAVARDGILERQKARGALRAYLLSLLPPVSLPAFTETLTAILIVGVNGSGKTTTIAKLAQRWKAEDKRVLLGAADTFRAAATDQLEVWSSRLAIDVIAGQSDADPGSVAYNAAQAALNRKADILLVDTAGRLHTRHNLMEELKKVSRVLGKAIPGAPHHTWLILDATTGQNAISQASAFREAVNADGVILTKLDGSARGGIAFRVQRELGLPILFTGIGEGAEDLVPFDREAFVDGLLE